ncbi:hypothetical protein ACFYN3_29555 [Streptomyces lavendulae]|uniref:hypothetical protein n=1 Tax=Streptomyces lavendulae TaxID=1914 RepID=UPI00367D0B3D
MLDQVGAETAVLDGRLAQLLPYEGLAGEGPVLVVAQLRRGPHPGRPVGEQGPAEAGRQYGPGGPAHRRPDPGLGVLGQQGGQVPGQCGQAGGFGPDAGRGIGGQQGAGLLVQGGPPVGGEHREQPPFAFGRGGAQEPGPVVGGQPPPQLYGPERGLGIRMRQGHLHELVRREPPPQFGEGAQQLPADGVGGARVDGEGLGPGVQDGRGGVGARPEGVPGRRGVLGAPPGTGLGRFGDPCAHPGQHQRPSGTGAGTGDRPYDGLAVRGGEEQAPRVGIRPGEEARQGRDGIGGPDPNPAPRPARAAPRGPRALEREQELSAAAEEEGGRFGRAGGGFAVRRRHREDPSRRAGLPYAGQPPVPQGLQPHGGQQSLVPLAVPQPVVAHVPRAPLSSCFPPSSPEGSPAPGTGGPVARC